MSPVLVSFSFWSSCCHWTEGAVFLHAAYLFTSQAFTLASFFLLEILLAFVFVTSCVSMTPRIAKNWWLKQLELEKSSQMWWKGFHSHVIETLFWHFQDIWGRMTSLLTSEKHLCVLGTVGSDRQRITVYYSILQYHTIEWKLLQILGRNSGKIVMEMQLV